MSISDELDEYVPVPFHRPLCLMVKQPQKNTRKEAASTQSPSSSNFGSFIGDFPILSSMTCVLRKAERHQLSSLNTLFGTSERDRQYLDYSKAELVQFHVLTQYRYILDNTPFIKDLSGDIKNSLFQSAMLLLGSHPSNRRMYIRSNAYFDLDLSKIIAHLDTNKKVTPFKKQKEDLSVIGRELLEALQYTKTFVCPSAAEALRTNEDLTALILFAVIHSSQHIEQSTELMSSMTALKLVFKELHRYDNTYQRHASHWGQLVLLLSPLITAASKFGNYFSTAQMFFNGTIFARVQGDGHLDNCYVKDTEVQYRDDSD
ncbi:hypothetical protein L596_020635 [Steinernema carpocapsae]|uniref:NR LBD domain-containing protein n=2 Tax=Steinernema carpocapsae TaxID=34508 RepID=A0A4U5MUT0_STECR|nr:hypothetical protein L596_020635 [Steinernema carpocapsae]